MATVTGLTAARTLELLDTTIIDGDVVNGDLILTKKSGETINAGPVQGPTGVCHVHSTVGIAIPSQLGWTTLNFDGERRDPNNLHSQSSNTSRITIGSDGEYVLGAMISWPGNATGLRSIAIVKNGTTDIAFQQISSVGSMTHVQSLVGRVTAVAGDYFEVRVRQDSGSSLTLNANSYAPDFWLSTLGTKGDTGPQGPSGALTGSAGGVLSGTYPDPNFAQAMTTEATRSASGKGYVNHGATANTARPSGYASIEWVGSVEPTNAVNGDTWINTT